MIEWYQVVSNTRLKNRTYDGRGLNRRSLPFWVAYNVGHCVQLTVDGLAHVLCMTELLDSRDTDSCRPLASRHQTRTSSRHQSSPHFDRYLRPATAAAATAASKALPQRHIIVDKCCTLHCRRQMLHHGRHHRMTATSRRRLERDVVDINRYLRLYLGRLDDAERQNRVARDWRLVARLLDRLFFFMYVSTVAVSLATIFPKGWLSNYLSTPITSQSFRGSSPDPSFVLTKRHEYTLFHTRPGMVMDHGTCVGYVMWIKLISCIIDVITKWRLYWNGVSSIP